MEISTGTTAATSLSLPSPVPNPKSPESDPTPPTAAVVFTPTTRIQPTKPSPLTNGVLKRHPPTIAHKPDSTTTSYKECLKNHAAAIGGHALDGCGEFMPSPHTIATDPTTLKCAACGCHRNFHRREPEESSSPLPLTSTTHHVIEYHPHHRHHPPAPPHHNIPRSPSSQSPPPISSSYAPHHMLLALSDGGIPQQQHQQQQPGHIPVSYSRNLGSGRSAGRDHNSAPTAGGGGHGHHNQGRKRFRTKFTLDQKERMHEFAEKVGWKMQKCNEEMVAEFCNEVGVERGVLKVWMHNNKNTYGKRDFNGNLIISSGTVEEIQHRDEEDDEKNSNEILREERRTTPVTAAATANCSSILTATVTATTIG